MYIQTINQIEIYKYVLSHNFNFGGYSSCWWLF